MREINKIKREIERERKREREKEKERKKEKKTLKSFPSDRQQKRYCYLSLVVFQERDTKNTENKSLHTFNKY